MFVINLMKENTFEAPRNLLKFGNSCVILQCFKVQNFLKTDKLTLPITLIQNLRGFSIPRISIFLK